MDARKTLMAGLLISAASMANSKNLNSYSELVASLRAGIPVNAVIDVDKCHFANNEPDPWEMKTFGARFNVIYERTGKDIERQQKMRLVATAEEGYVGWKSMYIMRTLFRIFEDGTTEVIRQDIDPKTFKVTQKALLFCRLSADANTGVTLTTTK